MKFHLIKKSDFNGVCIYCGKKIEGLCKSLFDPHSRLHYKVRKCKNCGKKEEIKVGFEGSGHDDFTIEDKL